MPGLLIPSDWDEQTDGFIEMRLTIPNSHTWRTNFAGAVWSYLVWEGQWDPVTGDVDNAVEVARTAAKTIEFV